MLYSPDMIDPPAGLQGRDVFQVAGVPAYKFGVRMEPRVGDARVAQMISY